MLDKEIYGIIAALGVLLAIFFVFFYMLNLMRSNAKLRKYRDAPDMADYVKSQRLKVLLMFAILCLLGGCLLLIKKYLL